MFDEKTFCEGCKHHVREGACNAAGCVKIRGKFKATVVPETNKRYSEIAKSCRNCGNRINDGGLYGLCKSHLSRTGDDECCTRWIPKKQDGK